METGGAITCIFTLMMGTAHVKISGVVQGGGVQSGDAPNAGKVYGNNVRCYHSTCLQIASDVPMLLLVAHANGILNESLPIQGPKNMSYGFMAVSTLEGLGGNPLAIPGPSCAPPGLPLHPLELPRNHFWMISF